MMKNTKELLIEKFNLGQLSEEESSELELLFQKGELDIEDMEMYSMYDSYLDNNTYNMDLADAKFKTMLSKQIKDQELKERRKNWFAYLPLPIKWVIPACLVLLGFLGGQYWDGNTKNTPIIYADSNAKTMLHEMIHHPSSSRRMNVVNNVTSTSQNEDQTIKMLFLSLNHDNSSSVRMAAIDAIMQYADDENVRKQLIDSIREQKSPLVIQYLSEALKIIGEKMTLDKFRTLYNNEIPLDVIDQMESNLHITKT